MYIDVGGSVVTESDVTYIDNSAVSLDSVIYCLTFSRVVPGDEGVLKCVKMCSYAGVLSKGKP